jgi:hypothetical protein
VSGPTPTRAERSKHRSPPCRRHRPTRQRPDPAPLPPHAGAAAGERAARADTSAARPRREPSKATPLPPPPAGAAAGERAARADASAARPRAAAPPCRRRRRRARSDHRRRLSPTRQRPGPDASRAKRRRCPPPAGAAAAPPPPPEHRGCCALPLIFVCGNCRGGKLFGEAGGWYIFLIMELLRLYVCNVKRFSCFSQKMYHTEFLN